MEDTRYNNRELDHFLKDMREQLDRIEKDGKETRVQTTMHNGRLSKTELNISTVNTKINTTIAVGGILLPVVLSLGGYIFYLEIKATKDAIPREVTDAVYQALETYQFEVVNPLMK